MTAHRSVIAGQMPLVSLIVLCAVTALLTDRFLSPLNLTNILVQSSIMAVIAMGMTFVIVGGGFDLSVGSTAALSGCIAAMVMLEAGIAAGVAAGVVAGAAVGLANGRNPVSIVVPCHRVIGSDGSLTGYGGGLERKRFLLELENPSIWRDPSRRLPFK